VITKKLIIVGCGGFARELINWVEDSVELGKSVLVTGALDDNPNAFQGFPSYVSYLGRVSDYTPQVGDEFLMAIGDPKVKKSICLDLRTKGASFASLTHPSAVIAKSARLGEGVVVCPQAFVSADAVVGDLCSINGNSSVGHDVLLASFSTLSAHVDLTGGVQVEECVFFGSGARVLPNLRIGMGARIGAGAVVVRGVPPGAVVFAPPAKRL